MRLWMALNSYEHVNSGRIEDVATCKVVSGDLKGLSYFEMRTSLACGDY